MRRIQRLVFWAFVCAFFITAFAVLFYAFGYRFSWERGIFIYTGSISIKSLPQTVSVQIDGEPVPEQNLGILNNAILISGLKPGEHFIRVSADGYVPWSKKAVVQSGLSADFWNVLLVKENYASEKIAAADSVIKIFPAPDQNLLAVAKIKNNEFFADTLDTGTMRSEQIFSLPQATLATDEENLEWSPDNRKLIIPLEQDGKRAYYVVNVGDKTSGELQKFLPAANSLFNPRWDPTTRNFIFYLSGHVLYRANTESPESTPLYVRGNILAYDISGNNLYYLQDNGIIYRTDANTDTEPTQITTSPVDINQGSVYSLIVYGDNLLAAREIKKGKLWIYNKLSPAETVFKPLIEEQARGAQFSDDGKKLLFFTDNEIAVYFTSDWLTQPTRERNTTLQIARFSNTIKNVQWTKDYEHVAFTLNGSVKIAELDHRDRRNMEQIISFDVPVAQMLSRFGNNRLYFVLENGELHFIDFPEKSGLFGF